MEANRPSTVVYATDEAYWPHVYVSVYSLLVNNRNRSWQVYILCKEPDKLFASRIPFLQRTGNLAAVEFVTVDCIGSPFADAPVMLHLNEASYFRLLLGRIIRDDVRRVLYLDADTVVTDSLEKLLSIDLDGRLLAAAEDKNQHLLREHCLRLGLPPGTPYFNSGVLVVDVARWRSIGAETQLREYLRDKFEKIGWADQDVLNGVFHSDWRPFPSRFNCVTGDRDGRPDVAVVHYAGRKKPWQLATANARKTAYWRYRQKTPYAVSRASLVVADWRQRAAALVGRYLARLAQLT